MKRFALLALLLIPTVADAQWIKGFNFRNALTDCTDSGNDQGFCYNSGVGDTTAYPTAINGTGGAQNFGSTNNAGDNKRSRGGANCKLYGISFRANNAAAQNIARFNVPAAGDYKIRLAIGDVQGVGPSTNQKVEIVDSDGTTVLSTITAASVSANHHVDATGVDRTSDADWASNNAQLTVTASGTDLYVRWGYGDGSTSGYTALSHIELEQVATDNLPILQAIGEE